MMIFDLRIYEIKNTLLFFQMGESILTAQSGQQIIIPLIIGKALFDLKAYFRLLENLYNPFTNEHKNLTPCSCRYQLLPEKLIPDHFACCSKEF